jgi:hypothetical protein
MALTLLLTLFTGAASVILLAFNRKLDPRSWQAGRRAL